MQLSRLKSDFLYVLKVSRPRFWLYTAGPVLLGLGAHIDVYAFYLFLYFLIPANIFLYGVNDIWDRDTDAYNPKKIQKESKVSSHRDVELLRYATIFSAFLALPILIWGGSLIRILMGLYIVLSYFYSAPPVRLKSRIFLDSMSNMLYIVPGCISYAYVTGGLPPASIIIGGAFWTWAMHLFSAIPDIAPDKSAHVQTTAVFLGTRGSLFLCMLYWGLATYSVLHIDVLRTIGLLFVSIPAILLVTGASNKQIDVVYWYFPMLNGIIGFGLYLYSAWII